MPLETIIYVPDLVPANPTVADGLNQGDDHIRGIKSALKNSLPNFTAAALVSSNAEIDAVAHTGQLNAQDGSAAAPSVAFKTASGMGFYKKDATHIGVSTRLSGGGVTPAGALFDFPKQPTSRFTNGGVVGGGQAAVDYIECDGSLYNITDFPDLGAFLGNNFGGDGTTTFRVPNTCDSGRFRRSRSSGVTAGTFQANQTAQHNHTATTDSQGGHSHAITVNSNTTGVTLAPVNNLLVNNALGGSVYLGNGAFAGATASLTDPGHVHTASSDTQGAHTHTITVGNAGSGTETRPESFVVVTCIKT